MRGWLFDHEDKVINCKEIPRIVKENNIVIVKIIFNDPIV